MRIQFMSDKVMVFSNSGMHVDLTYPEWFACLYQWEEWKHINSLHS